MSRKNGKREKGSSDAQTPYTHTHTQGETPSLNRTMTTFECTRKMHVLSVNSSYIWCDVNPPHGVVHWSDQAVRFHRLSCKWFYLCISSKAESSFCWSTINSGQFIIRARAINKIVIISFTLDRCENDRWYSTWPRQKPPVRGLTILSAIYSLPTDHYRQLNSDYIVMW